MQAGPGRAGFAILSDMRATTSLALLAAVVALNVIAQEPAPGLSPLVSLVGEWNGHETGAAGVGKGSRSYKFVLGGRYLHSRNTSRFAPQEKNPKGETHEDWTIFSFDRSRRRIIARQFNSEGFVNHLVQDLSNGDPRTLVFVSESSENAPPGLRARLTYLLRSDAALEEVFELAMPGKDFVVYLRNSWKRAE